MIYYVEDDPGIRELVLYSLRNTGFEAEGFERDTSFFEALRKKLPSLILLDIMLPGEDGISILRRLRADNTTSEIPVIMVTAKGSEYDRVIGLDCGADDYITKPFGIMELISRIRALLRRCRTESDDKEEILVRGDITIDVKGHRVTLNNNEIELTLKEFELLNALARNAGIVLTRDTLLKKIWGYDFDGETRTVDVHIRMLRQKLGSSGGMIETVRGVGYRINK